MIEALATDCDGGVVLKVWGNWYLAAFEGELFIDCPEGYWIAQPRWREPDWERHVGSKPRFEASIGDFSAAIDWCRRLTKKQTAALLLAAELLGTGRDTGTKQVRPPTVPFGPLFLVDAVDLLRQ